MRKVIFFIIAVLSPFSARGYRFILTGSGDLRFNFYGGFYTQGFLPSFEEILNLTYGTPIYDPDLLIIFITPRISNENFLNEEKDYRYLLNTYITAYLFENRPFRTRLYYYIGYNKYRVSGYRFSDLYQGYGGNIKLVVDRLPPVNIYYGRSWDYQRDFSKGGLNLRKRFGKFEVYSEVVRHSIKFQGIKTAYTYFRFYNNAHISDNFSFYNNVDIGVTTDTLRSDKVHFSNYANYIFNPSFDIDGYYTFEKDTIDGSESRGHTATIHLNWKPSKKLFMRGWVETGFLSSEVATSQNTDREEVGVEFRYIESGWKRISPLLNFTGSVGRVHLYQDGFSDTNLVGSAGAGAYLNLSLKWLYMETGAEYSYRRGSSEVYPETHNIKTILRMRTLRFWRGRLFFEEYTHYYRISGDGTLIMEEIYSQGLLRGLINSHLRGNLGIGYRRAGSTSYTQELYILAQFSGTIVRRIPVSFFIKVDIPSWKLSSGGSLGASISYTIDLLEVGASFEYFVLEGGDRYRGSIYLRRRFGGLFNI